jgi:hypothetical protein
MDPKSADTDRDGLRDAYEAIRSHTDPLARDTDSDGRSDAFEVAHGTSAGHIPGIAGVSGQGQFAEVVRGGLHDADHDGVSNKAEHLLGLDPHAADTDFDGLSDSAEVALGTDATVVDTDADGFSDSAEVRFGMDPLQAGAGAPLGDGLGTEDASGTGIDDGSAGVDPGDVGS